MGWESTLMQPVEQMWASIVVFIPRLGVVILILLIGWILATIFQKVITRFFKLARFDTLSEKIGIANILNKGDINYTLSEIVGVLVYWLMMLIVVLAAVNALQLNVAAELLRKVVEYVPNVIASLFILVLGMFFANIIANTVRTACANAGMHQARFLGQLTQVVLMTCAVMEALKQLKIDMTFIQMIVIAILASISIGVGLAIGLGCKDIAAKFVQQAIDSFKIKK